MNEYIAKALLSLRPNSEFSFIGDDYSTIEWHVIKGTKPTPAEIDAAIEKVKADEAAQAAKKAELLARLGITEAEAKLLLA